MTTRTRAVIAATAAGLVLGAHAADATPAPVAGEVTTVTATVQLGGTDGKTYLVTVTGRQSEFVGQPATSEVSVGWKSCVRARTGSATCSATTSYRIHTTSREFTVAPDRSTAHLVLRVANAPLHLDWTRDSTTQSFRFQADQDGLAVSDPTGTGPGTATGTVFAVPCHGPATIEVDHVVHTATPHPLTGSTAAPRLPTALTTARRCLTA